MGISKLTFLLNYFPVYRMDIMNIGIIKFIVPIQITKKNSFEDLKI